MAITLTSSPIRIQIQAAPTLGAGSDAGSFGGDLWTPGRDAQGTINLVSWNSVPPGRWVDVAGTRLDALDSAVKAAIPGWRDHGSMSWNGVTDAWNGVAADADNCRAWWVCAGGHADSSNNGIFRFDALKMAYAIEHLPSDTTAWSDNYRLLRRAGSFTVCPESGDQYASASQAGTWKVDNDWFYDELYWDHQPTSRHVYSGTLYLPGSNELVLACRRLWRYSISKGEWVHRRVVGDNPDAKLGEECIAYQDAANGQLLIGACGSGGPYGNTFDLNSNAWTGYRPPWASWTWNGAADTRHGDLVTLFQPPQRSASATVGFAGQYLQFDLRNRKSTTAPIAFEDGLSRSDFSDVNAFYDGAGMVYVPPLNRYWLLTKPISGAPAWFELDPTTTPSWTLRRLTPAGRVPALHNNNANIRRRMVWMPSLSALVFLGSANRNISVYKF